MGLLASGVARSQGATSGYHWIPHRFEDISATMTVLMSYDMSNYFVTIDLPFDFPFYGLFICNSSFSRLVIGDNRFSGL